MTMCGGIACSLGASTGINRNITIPLFNLGRVISYCIAGILVSGSLQMVVRISDTRQLLSVIQWLAAILLIMIGLSVCQWWQGIRHIEGLGKGIWQKLAPYASRYLVIKRIHHALIIGLIWGWIPCGLVYSMLTWSAGQADWRYGGGVMLAFGLGTSFSMLAMAWLGDRAVRVLRVPLIRQIAGLSMMGLGGWQILHLTGGGF